MSVARAEILVLALGTGRGRRRGVSAARQP